MNQLSRRVQKLLFKLPKYHSIPSFKRTYCPTRKREYDEKSLPPNYWDYSEKYGPKYWPTQWKTGTHQSPIELCSKKAVFDPTLTRFTFDPQPLKFTAKNIGNNVSIRPLNKEIYLQGGPLSGDLYQFHELHIHWGEINVCGCEHVINGKRRAAELHIVHWNKTLYTTPIDAQSNANGLAVLGVHLDAQEHHTCNPFLDIILGLFHNLQYKHSLFTSTGYFSPYDFLPSHKKAYFTYPGSLSTPPLTENVTWTVFLNTVEISTKQWKQLNTTACGEEMDEPSHDRFCRQCIVDQPVISNNFRPIQPLNGRLVRRSFKVD